MLSWFWFVIVLMLIWSAFYTEFFSTDKDKSDTGAYFGIGFALSALLTCIAYEWLFSSLFGFIFSLMPKDNELLMCGTAGLLFFVVMLCFYLLPPVILFLVKKQIKRIMRFK